MIPPAAVSLEAFPGLFETRHKNGVRWKQEKIGGETEGFRDLKGFETYPDLSRLSIRMDLFRAS
jgi:hypothetical protein